MEAALNIIKSLGVNETIWIQLGLFTLSFIILNYVVFKPFTAALEGRNKATHGNTDAAESLTDQTQQIEIQYQNKIRTLNDETKSLFDRARTEAALDQEKVLNAAKEKARLDLEKYRVVIQEQFNKAREDLIKESPVLATAIAEKLLSDEVR
jgi:F-type H+-transporting ATPase subunit b